MRRLIDANNFLERMENDTDLCAEMEKDGLKALKKYLDMQPTAYDVDAVVAQLEKGEQTSASARTEAIIGMCGASANHYGGEEYAYQRAIEIVKGEVN